MPAPLDVIIRKHVAPMAKQEGVPRKGRYFRLEGEHGHTLLYFDTFNLYQTELCFEVGFALLPLTYWDFTCQLYEGGGAPTIPGRESIFLYSWLMPPDEWSYRPAEKPLTPSADGGASTTSATSIPSARPSRNACRKKRSPACASFWTWSSRWPSSGRRPSRLSWPWHPTRRANSC
ncbi:hypothetical protein ACFQ9X_22315 [Catenulispora yoronensis]